MAVRKPDFSGWATKNDLLCSDGRTIKAGSFKHQHQQKVPLVWQHMHTDPENVLGHAILEHRQEGVYAYAYLNESEKGVAAKIAVEHGDVTQLSIYANNLTQQGKNVLHGDIKEVSIVLAGANPGALIENINIQHSDGDVVTLDDEAFIYTGLELEHADAPGETNVADSTSSNDKTVKDVFDAMTEEQKNVVYFMIGEALADDDDDDDDDLKQGDIEISLDSQEIASLLSDTLIHSLQEDPSMARNVFESNSSTLGGDASAKSTLSHSQLKTIVEDAQKMGSFKESFLSHAVEYGIENIDILFPDAKALATNPEVIGRRQEWVSDVINGTKHSPFSRIKSTAVDLTADEARARGYVKGNLKKDEIIKLLKRVTTPTTIYKKQKLDRDDIVDITDLDVVAWLKAEMRLMLDEELGRAILIGDGRDSDDEDKIDEDHIRPIAYDNDMYAHQLTIGSDTSPKGIIEAVLRARRYYRGTGLPTMYTTDAILTDLILQEDRVGRRLYETEEALAAALRVRKIVTVEVMDDAPEVLAIIVNLADYTLGADQGGNVSMFDDFDIDYNQYKYLIETRVSGALTKPKSALVIKRTVGQTTSPVSPSYDGATHTITFPDIDGVIYSIEGVDLEGTYEIDETVDVEARPAAGYSFPAGVGRSWTFVYTP